VQSLKITYVVYQETKYQLFICLHHMVFHIWPKLTHPAARSLCDSWATCFYTSKNANRPMSWAWPFDHKATSRTHCWAEKCDIASFNI